MSFKPGEKVALCGGGMGNGFFYVATFNGWGKERDPVIPGSKEALLDFSEMPKGPHKMFDGFAPWVTEKSQGLPMGGSTWSLAPLYGGLEKLKHGYYLMTQNVVIDCGKMGFFSPVNGPVAAKLGRKGWIV